MPSLLKLGEKSSCLYMLILWKKSQEDFLFPLNVKKSLSDLCVVLIIVKAVVCLQEKNRKFHSLEHKWPDSQFKGGWAGTQIQMNHSTALWRVSRKDPFWWNKRIPDFLNWRQDVSGLQECDFQAFEDFSQQSEVMATVDWAEELPMSRCLLEEKKPYS